ncbi:MULTISPECIES: Ku protein [unclassified Frigoribacterium]|uniref:non-homologous end joining protein Ku n=1 Tax=unclassified Frigoribacterium TaxID=2627005 RepID=UPI001565FA81|nr:MULTISPECIES: Ku protein [unclassified Frigoribacterium]NQW88571.1 Ku protein [Frigoribacterium sp. VKM Ac-2860]NQX08620.1 Ku protein [Frigoribacterium sp. VKM Ac-2859]
MRSIWKGAITFGLVNVPVKLYSATEDHDVSLHQVHDADGGRIRYQRKCEICGKVVDYEHIDKAYDDGDRTVVITGDDLKSLPEERSREIDVLEFVPSDQVDPIMLDRSYFLEPDGTSPKAYVLLRRTLEETDRTAIVHFSLRQKTRLAALRVRGDVLMLQTLLWDDEVREARFPALEKQTRVSDKELDMSSSLVDSLSDDFEPADFSDDYQEQLRQLIDAKLEEGESLDTDATFGEKPEDDDEGGEVIDLMEALRRSVEKNRSGGHPKPTKKAASTSTTKPAAKKSPAKKEPSKKESSRSTSGGSGSAARKEPASSASDKKAAPKKKAG